MGWGARNSSRTGYYLLERGGLHSSAPSVVPGTPLPGCIKISERVSADLYHGSRKGIWCEKLEGVSKYSAPRYPRPPKPRKSVQTARNPGQQGVWCKEIQDIRTTTRDPGQRVGQRGGCGVVHEHAARRSPVLVCPAAKTLDYPCSGVLKQLG